MAVILPPRTVPRLPDQLRDLTIKYELLGRVDGSARFGFGETQVLASVSGPIEVRLANENPSKATFEVLVRPLSSIPGTEAKSLSATIRSLLSPSLLLFQNPRSLVQLVIQSLSPASVTGDGSKTSAGIIAAMINASTLALLNAAVPMRGVVCAVAVARLSSGLPLILDPTDDQISSSTASGCFAFMFASGTASMNKELDITQVWSNWQSVVGFDERELSEAKNLARAGAKEVWARIKERVGSVVDEETAQVEKLEEGEI